MSIIKKSFIGLNLILASNFIAIHAGEVQSFCDINTIGMSEFEQKIHETVTSNIHLLQNLDAKGFEAFKKDMLLIFNTAEKEQQQKYAPVITAFKNLNFKQ